MVSPPGAAKRAPSIFRAVTAAAVLCVVALIASLGVFGSFTLTANGASSSPASVAGQQKSHVSTIHASPARATLVSFAISALTSRVEATLPPLVSRVHPAPAASTALFAALAGDERPFTVRAGTSAGDDDDDDEPACEFVDKQPNPCAFVRQYCEGENLLNYLKLRYCVLRNGSGAGATFLFVLTMACVILLTLSLLASTADVFFVPALTVMSKLLNLSPSVAGMTFLALGNGAPDIFSALAALAADDVPLLLGAIIGAGVCIMGLVAGATIFVSTRAPNVNAFWRDIIAYSVALAVVFSTFANGSVSVYESSGLLALYVCYVAAVVIFIQVKRCRRASRERREARVRGVSVSQHRRALRRQESMRESLLSAEALESASPLDSDSPTAAAAAAAVAADEDLKEEYEEEDDGVDHTVFLTGLSYPHPQWEQAGALARALFKLQFVLELPFSLLRWLSMPSMHVRPDQWGPAKRFFGLASPICLSFMLLLAFAPDDMGSQLVGPLPKVVVTLLSGCAFSLVMTIVYYRWLLPAVARARAQAEAGILSAAGLIPGPGQVQSDLAAAAATGFEELEDEDWVPAISTAFKTVCSLLAFLGAIAWLVLISHEVVSALQAIGVVLDVSTAILGLTVLAIGNSIPDFIANTSLSRAGHAELALASVFASPLLTTLVGLGAPMLLTTAKQYPEPITFHVSQQVVVTWVSVTLAVMAHMLAFKLWNYQPPKAYGATMMLAYAVFLAVMVVNEITGPW